MKVFYSYQHLRANAIAGLVPQPHAMDGSPGVEWRHAQSLAISEGRKFSKARALESFFPTIFHVQPAVKIWHYFDWAHDDSNILQHLRQLRNAAINSQSFHVRSFRTPSGKKLYVRVPPTEMALKEGNKYSLAPFEYYLRESITKDGLEIFYSNVWIQEQNPEQEGQDPREVVKLWMNTLR